MHKPRRIGTIKEYQFGHWFLYHTEWEETTGSGGRKHSEVEVYYAKAVEIWASVQETQKQVWHTTQPKIVENAIKVFMENPEVFDDVVDGNIPVELEKLLGL